MRRVSAQSWPERQCLPYQRSGQSGQPESRSRPHPDARRIPSRCASNAGIWELRTIHGDASVGTEPSLYPVEQAADSPAPVSALRARGPMAADWNATSPYFAGVIGIVATANGPESYKDFMGISRPVAPNRQAAARGNMHSGPMRRGYAISSATQWQDPL